MANPKFTLYKHIKIDGAWRYFRAAVASNNKVKPHLVVIDGAEQKHEGGSCCVRHKNTGIDVGNDPAEALRQRRKLAEGDNSAPRPVAPAPNGTPLAAASEKYFANLAARGIDPDPFVKNCKKATVEESKT